MSVKAISYTFRSISTKTYIYLEIDPLSSDQTTLLPHPLGSHHLNKAILMWHLENLNHSSV